MVNADDMSPDASASNGKNNQEIDFLQDDPRGMTWGRRIALYMAQNFAWYNPYLNPTENDKDDTPSLAKAWAYFEHVTLQRHHLDPDGEENEENNDNANENNSHEEGPIGTSKTMRHKIVRKFHKGDRRLEIAEPGENQHATKLYSPLTTPLSQMGDFGLGYGIYFSTLRSYAILCLIAGILNLPNLFYFASSDYNGPMDQDDSVSFMLKGSAICTDVTWVPCPDCPKEYAYPDHTFAKWSHTTGLHVAEVNGGDWVNVSGFVNLRDIDHAVREETLYNYVEGDDAFVGTVFGPSTIAAFENELNVKITATQITLPGHIPRTCRNRDNETEANKCIEEYCFCQIESFQDCYCRFGSSLPGANLEVSTLGFAEKTNCEGATLRNGFINLATAFLFIFGAMYIRNRQNKLIVEFDEDEQTAQDYSICILNPPRNAHDPGEWKAYFEENFECKVTVCTVDVDNDNLVRLLVQRRELLHNLKLAIPGVEMSREELHKMKSMDKSELGGRAHKLVRTFQNVEDQIKEILREDRNHPATSVFVTFETEAGQREVLKWLSVGSFAARKNDQSSLRDPRHLFRGQHVLEVIEPEEPSAIRWQEMDSTPGEMISGILLTSFLCLVLVVITFTAVVISYRTFPAIGPIVTTVFTSIFPMFAKALMALEKHKSESSRQKWLFIKISCFNILIAAVLISVVNPFTATTDPTIESLPGLIPAVHALFFSQLLLTPVLQLLDISGNINRHIFAPRAKTQEEMNQQFGGTGMFLAERYANLMKFLFLIVWYCAVYPAGFITGFFALIIAYFADRFSLMRSWARTPQVGTEISDFARNYFTPAALALMAVLSSYAWSGFPYDNLCEYEYELNRSDFNKVWSLRERGTRASIFGIDLFKAPDVQETVAISEETKVYKYCLQDMRAYVDDPSFPPLPRFQLDEWMTKDQESLLNVYGWVGVAILALVLLSFVFRNVRNLVKEIKGGYCPPGDDMEISFSKIKSVDAYLPFCSSSLRYPLLLFDVSKVDSHLFSWTDPDRPHAHYDVTKDLLDVLDAGEIKAGHLFADVSHWPPT